MSHYEMKAPTTNSHHESPESPETEQGTMLGRLIKKKFWDRKEFHAIFEQAEEWKLLDEEEKEEIFKTFDSEEFKRIIYATIGINGFDGLANLGAGGVGIKEIFSGELDPLHSPAVHIFLGKFLVAPIFAYISWWNKEVKNKHLKAATAAIPLIGGVAFPRAALGSQYKFFKIYNKTKKDYRAMMDEVDGEARQEKEEALKKKLEMKLQASVRKRVMNIVEAQGFPIEEVKVPEFVREDPEGNNEVI